MKRHILLVLCLGITGCAPAYLAVLDSSAALTGHMTTVGTIGPVNMQTDSGNVRFLPLKPTPTETSLAALNVQSGFAITESAGYDYLSFVYEDSSGQAQVAPSNAFPLDAAPSAYPQYEFDVAATTTTTIGNIVIFNFNPAVLTAYLYQVNLPYGGFTTSPGTTLLSTLFSGYRVLGDQLVPSQSGEAFYFLLWNGTSFGEGKAGVATPPSALGTGTPAGTTPALPVGLAQRTRYGTEPLTGLSYVSSFNGSQWVCYQWTSSTTPIQLTGVTHRLDAVLTTGDLLSTEGGVLRLYDPNGSLVVSVLLGGLQFCYEAYVGPTAYVFFSLPMDLSRSDWEFRVYAIPTSSMRGLGG